MFHFQSQPVPRKTPTRRRLVGPKSAVENAKLRDEVASLKHQLDVKSEMDALKRKIVQLELQLNSKENAEATADNVG